MKTQAARDKAHATRKAKAEQFKTQTIPVDHNWQIVRADELNWEIQRRIDGQWKFQGYFARLIDAFRALPHKLLAEDGISIKIEAALIAASKLKALTE